MTIHVKGVGTDTNGATLARVKRRVHSALWLFAHSVSRVLVRVDGSGQSERRGDGCLKHRVPPDSSGEGT